MTEYIVFEDFDGTYGVAYHESIYFTELAANMTKEEAEQYCKRMEDEEQ